MRVVDDSFLLLFNAHDEALDWVLPPEEFARGWRIVIDTAGVPESPEPVARRREGPRGGQGHGGAAGDLRGRIHGAEPGGADRHRADDGAGAGVPAGRHPGVAEEATEASTTPGAAEAGAQSRATHEDVREAYADSAEADVTADVQDDRAPGDCPRTGRTPRSRKPRKS